MKTPEKKIKLTPSEMKASSAGYTAEGGTQVTSIVCPDNSILSCPLDSKFSHPVYGWVDKQIREIGVRCIPLNGSGGSGLGYNKYCNNFHSGLQLPSGFASDEFEACNDPMKTDGSKCSYIKDGWLRTGVCKRMFSGSPLKCERDLGSGGI